MDLAARILSVLLAVALLGAGAIKLNGNKRPQDVTGDARPRRRRRPAVAG
jgi:hypothetical protein